MSQRLSQRPSQRLSQRAWTRGPVCGVDNCRSTLYTSNAGLQVCQYGHVVEGRIEIDDDQEENFVPTRRLGIQIAEGAFGDTAVVGSLVLADHEEKNSRLYGLLARSLYLEAVQVLLQRQIDYMTDCLVPELQGLKQQLIVVVKLFWLKVLSYPENGEKKPSILALDVVSIIYLAMLKLNKYPVYIYDILAGLACNKIPYLYSLHLVPGEMLKKLPVGLHLLLEPTALPTRDRLYQCIYRNGEKITAVAGAPTVPRGFEVSVSYYYPLVFRLLADEFMLPNAPETFALFHVLAETFEMGRLYLRFLPKTLATFPEVQVATLLMYTIKTAFTQHTLVSSLRAVNIQAWFETLQKRDDDGDLSVLKKPRSVRSRELVNLSDAKIQKYCDWIYENFIPKKYQQIDGEQPAADEISTMEKRLFKIFDITDEGDTTPLEHASLTYDYVKAVAMEPTQSIKPADVARLEAVLFDILSDKLGLSRESLVACYNKLGTEVEKRISSKSSSTATAPESVGPPSS